MKIEISKLKEKVRKKDLKWFLSLYYFEVDNETMKEYKVVYNENYGDGRDWIVVLYFKNHDLYVILKGYYSSWGESQFDSVSFGKPYEYKETRYKKINIEDDILNGDDNIAGLI